MTLKERLQCWLMATLIFGGFYSIIAVIGIIAIIIVGGLGLLAYLLYGI